MANKRLRWVAVSIALVIAVTALVGYLLRDELHARYLCHRLCHSGESQRSIHVEAIVSLDRKVLPALIRCFRQDNSQACANALVALTQLLEHWGPDDQRSDEAARLIADHCSDMSEYGKAACLGLAECMMQVDKPSRDMLAMAACLLDQAAKCRAIAVRERGLALAEEFKPENEQQREFSRALVAECLQADESEIRCLAIRVAVLPHVGMAEKALTLLRDSSPAVRRSALAAVGDNQVVLGTDDLLAWLHDEDPEVRGLCEAALKSRGLRDHHIRLGRLISDKRPMVRLQILDHLRSTSDLDPSVWLRRLSHDPDPAVRVGAVRAAIEISLPDFSDRLEQLAVSDPSLTVRQLAQYYLSCSKYAFGQ